MRKLSLMYFFLAVLVLGMTSCGEDPVAEITAFSFTSPVPGAGVIDQANKTIAINVPFGTELTNVTGAVVITDGATVSPDLTAGVDFSSLSVDFTVTNEDVSNTYTVTVIEGENPLRIALVGPGATLNDNHDEVIEAYTWALNTYQNKAAYFAFGDLTAEHLATAEVVWYHAYDTTSGGRTIAPQALTAKGVINDYYQGGGDLLLTTHATSYLVELGRLTSDWGPTDGGWGNNSGNANPDDWGIAYQLNGQFDDGDNKDHPLFSGITPKSVTFDGITYDAMMLIDGGLKRDAAYFWFANVIPGMITNFDTNGNGGIDPDTELDTNGDGVFNNDDDVNARKDYFEQQTNSVVRGSFEWDPVANGVEFFNIIEFNPDGNYQGKAITIAVGGYEWLQSDGRSNAWRVNQETITANAFTYFGVE